MKKKNPRTVPQTNTVCVDTHTVVETMQRIVVFLVAVINLQRRLSVCNAISIVAEKNVHIFKRNFFNTYHMNNGYSVFYLN